MVKKHKMSSNKTDKKKWSHKLHQLQKRIHRMIENDDHSIGKEGERKGFLKKIKDKLKSKK